jgi:hypothetical protein
MTAVEVVTASSGDQDAVVGILRAASAAGARASTWGREFPHVIRDLPDGLVHDNERLRAYHEGLGFAHAGDVDCLPRTTRPGYRAASRYQRAVRQ